MELIATAQIIAGFIILAKASEFAIKRAINISTHIGLSEYIISFIAMGIISVFPELGISVASALEGEPQFGLGILIGGNIADLTLVVGIVALFAGHIRMREKMIKSADRLLLAISMPAILLLDGEISQFDGALLLFCFALYVHGIINSEHPLNRKVTKAKADAIKEAALLLAAILIILISGHFITEGAKTISAGIGLPIFIFGIVLSVGTCMPELIFSLQAAKKNKLEMGFGDIIGNVFADATAVIGIVAMISPIRPSQPEIAISSSIIMAISLAILIFIFNQKKEIGKMAGIGLIMLYVIFLIAQFILEAGALQ